MPETSGVPEGLCCSGHQDPWDTTPPALGQGWSQGWEGFGTELAAWWLLVQECILSISPCSHPTLLRCLGLVLAGCTGTFSVRDTFLPHWLCLSSPTVFWSFVVPQSSHPASFGCWGLDVAPQLKQLPGSMLPANGKNVLLIVLACSWNNPAVSSWAQAAFCRMLTDLAECSTAVMVGGHAGQTHIAKEN